MCGNVIIVCPSGLGQKNERGEELAEFCQSQTFTITNKWFAQQNRRKHTWISHGDTTKGTKSTTT